MSATSPSASYSSASCGDYFVVQATNVQSFPQHEYLLKYLDGSGEHYAKVGARVEKSSILLNGCSNPRVASASQRHRRGRPVRHTRQRSVHDGSRCLAAGPHASSRGGRGAPRQRRVRRAGERPEREIHLVVADPCARAWRTDVNRRSSRDFCRRGRTLAGRRRASRSPAPRGARRVRYLSLCIFGGSVLDAALAQKSADHLLVGSRGTHFAAAKRFPEDRAGLSVILTCP